MSHPITLPPLARITRAERETIIRWDEEARTVVVWSCSAPVLRKLLRLGFTPAQQSWARDGRLHGMEFRLPQEQFRWGLKRRAPANRPVKLSASPVDAILSTEHAANVRGTAPDIDPSHTCTKPPVAGSSGESEGLA